MRKSLALILIVLGSLSLFGGIAAAGNEENEGVCQPQTEHLFPVGDAPEITITAPEGQLIVGYCVKAGSIKQGNGPEYVTVDPPAASVTITHSSGKDISHYTVSYGPVTTTTTVPEETTTTTVGEETTTTTTTVEEPTTTTSTVPETTTTTLVVDDTTTTTAPDPETSTTTVPVEETSTTAPVEIGTPVTETREELPRTGGDAWLLMGIAVGLIALGALLVRR